MPPQNPFQEYGKTIYPDIATSPSMATAPPPSTIDIADNGDEDRLDFARLAELFKPQTGASERLAELAGKFPVMKKPSVLRRIGGALASLQSLGHPEREAGARLDRQRILYGPYLDELEAWKLQVDPLTELASAERGLNTGSRLALTSLLGAERADRNLARQIKRDEAREVYEAARLNQFEAGLSQGRERLEIAQKNAETAAYRAEIAAMVARGGQYRVNKFTGKGEMIFRDGSTIELNQALIPQEDLLRLQQNYAIDRIQFGAEQRAKTAARRVLRTDVVEDPSDPTRQRRILVSIEEDEEGNRIAVPVNLAGTGKPAAPTTRTGKTTSELELQRRRNSLALRIKVQDPAGKYVQFNKQGEFMGIRRPPPTGGGWFGPTQKDYDRLAGMIYEGNPPPDIPDMEGGSAGPAAQPPAAQPTASQPPKPGMVRVRLKATGQTGWVSPPVDTNRYELIK